MSKDQWFRNMERNLVNGVPYDKAGELARSQTREQLADKADRLKDRMKEEGRWPPKESA